ncbi:uncharacterized protein [Zea mays]|uniref:uncharacterized protein n=1 Tax=Zea mays TaxID=4577 RepID=UPI0009A9B567|nr:uncharacterized protein LOC109941373 [Zea mays]|eukprot:XP_020397743.1 uncharacterized protein LOC109941373 [Zea mays]
MAPVAAPLPLPASSLSSLYLSSTPPETSTSFPVLPLSAVDLSPRRRPPLLPWPSPARRTRPRLTPAGPLLVVASVPCRRQAARRDARGRLDVIPCSVRRPEAVPASPGPSCSCCAVSRAKAVWLSLLRAQSPTVVAPCFSETDCVVEDPNTFEDDTQDDFVQETDCVVEDPNTFEDDTQDDFVQGKWILPLHILFVPTHCI